MAEARILVAILGAPHGVRGELRVKSLTAEPMGFADYGPLTTRDGRILKVRPLRRQKDMVIARIDGVSDRDAAARLTNLELFADRARLPAPEEDEFYQADLIGLEAVTLAGERIGHIVAVPDYGAGDLLDIARDSQPNALVPFTRAIVPEVDIAGGRVVVDPPAGLLDPGGENRDEEQSADASS